jgi:hypothetical protein
MHKRDYFFIFIMATYLSMNTLLIIAFFQIWQTGSITFVEHSFSIRLFETAWLLVSLLLGILMTWRRIIRIGEHK